MIQTSSSVSFLSNLSKLISLSLLFFVFSSCERAAPPKSYFPEVGEYAVQQRTLDLGNDFKVLSLALRPGQEDLAGLAYFRFARGAQIMSAYVSNGEAGMSDVRGELPPYFAANLRTEAAAALNVIGGEAYFLNLSDVTAARDSATVRASWPSDSVQTRLLRLLSHFRPDIILVARPTLHQQSEENWAQHCLLADLSAAVQRADTMSVNYAAGLATGPWKVARIWNEAPGGVSLPIAEVHSLWKKDYRTMAAEASRAYTSIPQQRQAWLQSGDPTYMQLWPAHVAREELQNLGLPLPPTKKLNSLERRVQRLVADARKGKSNEIMWEIASLRDSVSVLLSQPAFLESFERRRLLHWNKQLEDLRCTLLGIEVSFTLSDSVVTDRQVNYLKIDKVKGLGEGGVTSVLFGFMERGWVVDENIENKLPLRTDPPYRLLSPENLPYTFPGALHVQQANSANKGVLLFVIHQSNKREESFVYRAEVKMQYAPRFVTEVLTPIVRYFPGEELAVRLTNFSRDGVTDTLWVQHELASSSAGPFRLPGKGKTHLDTLQLYWNEPPEEGSYLLPLRIADLEVANFAARKFDVEIDRNLKVGVLAAQEQSPTVQAIRRLGLTPIVMPTHADFVQQLEGLSVLVLDRRVLTLNQSLSDLPATLTRFMTNGGRVLVLAQDAEAWNQQPLLAGLRLTATQQWDAGIAVRERTAGRLQQPNRLRPEDWQEWLFQRAYNALEVTSASALVLLEAENGSPLVVAQPEGAGGMLYVDLALQPQWLNVHAGAFRVLANLLSYRFERPAL